MDFFPLVQCSITPTIHGNGKFELKVILIFMFRKNRRTD